MPDLRRQALENSTKKQTTTGKLRDWLGNANNSSSRNRSISSSSSSYSYRDSRSSSSRGSDGWQPKGKKSGWDRTSDSDGRSSRNDRDSWDSRSSKNSRRSVDSWSKTNSNSQRSQDSRSRSSRESDRSSRSLVRYTGNQRTPTEVSHPDRDARSRSSHHGSPRGQHSHQDGIDVDVYERRISIRNAPPDLVKSMAGSSSNTRQLERENGDLRRCVAEHQLRHARAGSSCGSDASELDRIPSFRPDCWPERAKPTKTLPPPPPPLIGMPGSYRVPPSPPMRIVEAKVLPPGPYLHHTHWAYIQGP